MKFGFYVSNNATRLKKAILFCLEKKLDLLNDLAFVLIDSKNNFELETLLCEAKIPLIEEDLSRVEKEKGLHISNRLLALGNLYKIDYFFLFCSRLLKGPLLKDYQNRIINFHPSLLPSFRGFSAIDRALEAKSFIIGNTAHFIDEKADEGLTIMQSILPSFFLKDYDSVLDMQIFMLLQICLWLKDNRIVIRNERVYVENGDYRPSYFIPNIESDLIKLYVEANWPSKH